MGVVFIYVLARDSIFYLVVKLYLKMVENKYFKRILNNKFFYFSKFNHTYNPLTQVLREREKKFRDHSSLSSNEKKSYQNVNKHSSYTNMPNVIKPLLIYFAYLAKY